MIYTNRRENTIMMKTGPRLISHRGNISGKSKYENDPSYINDALYAGFDVEVDVNFKDNEFWLGHDKPLYKIEIDFLVNKNLWCHLKDKESLKHIVNIVKKDIHYFWHTHEDLVITSLGYIWHHSKSQNTDFTSKSIVVLPEIKPPLYKNINNCYGICSDYIKLYDNIYNE